MYNIGSTCKNNKFIFSGNSVAVGVSWQEWRKPKNFSFCNIFLLGSGGGGGTGTRAAAGAAGGGGGGGSSGQTNLAIPLYLLPEVLYISVAIGSTSAGFASYVSAMPNSTANHVIAIANGGGVGGNASAGTGGIAGTAGAIATAATMPLGWLLTTSSALAGQAGTAGGTTVAGTALTLPVTGLCVTGGTGGGGLPAGASSVAGGAFTVPAAPSFFPPQPGGIASTGATVPPGVGSNGIPIQKSGLYWYGGTGGGSTWGAASGAGLVQAAGGRGGIGCGGGGMGGALTGSTAGIQSIGGDGICIITVY